MVELPASPRAKSRESEGTRLFFSFANQTHIYTYVASASISIPLCLWLPSSAFQRLVSLVIIAPRLFFFWFFPLLLCSFAMVLRLPCLFPTRNAHSNNPCERRAQLVWPQPLPSLFSSFLSLPHSYTLTPPEEKKNVQRALAPSLVLCLWEYINLLDLRPSE